MAEETDKPIPLSNFPSLSPKRASLRKSVVAYSEQSTYDLIELFDLWCKLETLKPFPGWQISVSHIIRELMEALYKDKELLTVPSRAHFQVDTPFEVFQIPETLNDKLKIDFDNQTLTWQGTMSELQLIEIQELCSSHAYKYGCWGVFQQLDTRMLKMDGGLEKLLGRYPLRVSLTAEQELISTFKKVRKYFTNACHSALTQTISEEEWEGKIEEAESILQAFIGEEIEIMNEIQSVINEFSN